MRNQTGIALFRLLFVAALADRSDADPAAPSAASPIAAASGQVQNGVVVQVRLGTRQLGFANGAGGTATTAEVQGAFLAGYKVDRFIFGLGIDVLRTSAESSSSPQFSGSQSQTALLISPGVQMALLRSADQRVELFAELDLGYGHVFASNSAQTTPPDTSNRRIDYTVGPGLRFWAAPQFAFAGLVGLSGDFATVSETMGTFTQTNSISVTSIVAQLQLMGVF
jgi:hypothetical protein